MFGINAQARNTPGGIYDRFAELMGILATAPNHRRQIENQRSQHDADLAERKREHDQDYDLKKQYYESLAGKPSAAGQSLAWRQALEQNVMPPNDALNDETGEPILSNGKPVMVPPGSPNYLSVMGADGAAPNVVHTPDIRQQITDDTKNRQMSAYLEATGHPFAPPAGIASVQARGENPYASALGAQPPAPTDPAAQAPGPSVATIDPVVLDEKLRALPAAQHAQYDRIKAIPDQFERERRLQLFHQRLMSSVP